jgi:hypothetical protein
MGGDKEDLIMIMKAVLVEAMLVGLPAPVRARPLRCSRLAAGDDPVLLGVSCCGFESPR